MKRFVVVLFAAFLVLGAVGSADATLFEFGYDVTLNDVEGGLVVHWGEIFPNPGALNLEVSHPQEVTLFSLWTDEPFIDPDDTSIKEITVDFNFTSPPFSGQVGGGTQGWSVFGLFQGGAVTWNDPVTLNFGSLGDGELEIDLSDSIFNLGIFGTNPGECAGAEIVARFDLKSDASSTASRVPEPASMLLLGTGIVGLSGFRKKLKKK